MNVYHATNGSLQLVGTCSIHPDHTSHLVRRIATRPDGTRKSCSPTDQINYEAVVELAVIIINEDPVSLPDWNAQLKM